MAGLLERHTGWKRFLARFHISVAAVERRQLGAQVHDLQVHHGATEGTGVILGGGEHPRPKSLALAGGVDAEQSEVCPLSMRFHIHASPKRAIFLNHQKGAGAEPRPDLVQRDAVDIHEKLLHLEGQVDEPGQGLGVGQTGDADGFGGHGMDRSKPCRLEAMDEWRFIAERKIREAMEDGVFERLDGAGKPLRLEENPFEDPALRMAHRLLRNNGFAPAWIEESRDIDSDAAILEAVLPRLDAAERKRRVDDLNRRIAAYNLKTPVACAQKLPIRL